MTAPGVARLPPASIAVVNYNTPTLVPGCLDALGALDYPEVEILLVDNAERPEDAVPALPEEAGVRLLRPGANLGFAGGANLAWREARGDLLAVVNPDVRVAPGWLRALAGGLAAHAEERAAILGGKLLYPDGRVQHAGGVFAFPAASGAHRGHGAADDPAFAADAPVAFVTGAALAITREAATRLGGFDAGFWPAYFEDVDLCARAWAAGYSVWYISAAQATHRESASLEHGGAAYFRYYQRNRLRYVLRHYAAAQVRGPFAAAEEARLRGDLAPADRASSLNVYADPAALAAVAGAPGKPPALPPLAPGSAAARHAALEASVAETQAAWRVAARPFQSRIPGLAWLRTRLNNLWTRWYVDPIVAQQVEYNAALARAVRELAAQVSGLEAALRVHAGLEQALAPPAAEAVDPAAGPPGPEGEHA